MSRGTIISVTLSSLLGVGIFVATGGESGSASGEQTQIVETALSEIKSNQIIRGERVAYSVNEFPVEENSNNYCLIGANYLEGRTNTLLIKKAMMSEYLASNREVMGRRIEEIRNLRN